MVLSVPSSVSRASAMRWMPLKLASEERTMRALARATALISMVSFRVVPFIFW